MIWMISIKPRYAQDILDGKKDIEVRRLVPKALQKSDIIFVTVTGTGGAVKFVFKVDDVLKVEKVLFWEIFSYRLSLSRTEYEGYLHGVFFPYGLEIHNPRRLSDGYTVEDFGLKRAPQSFAQVKHIPESLKSFLNEYINRL